jgi:hypothetical protein
MLSLRACVAHTITQKKFSFNSSMIINPLRHLTDNVPDEKPAENLLKKTYVKGDEDEDTKFTTLFRKSKFVQLNDIENSLLIGKIIDIVGDDLYIDYGGKFNCVCKNPFPNRMKFVSFFNFLLFLFKKIQILKFDNE